MNASGGAVAVALPDATRWPRRKITAKKVDASGDVVTLMTQGGQTVDGVAFGKATATQWAGWTPQSDGSNWLLI